MREADRPVQTDSFCFWPASHCLSAVTETKLQRWLSRLFAALSFFFLSAALWSSSYWTYQSCHFGINCFTQICHIHHLVSIEECDAHDFTFPPSHPCPHLKSCSSFFLFFKKKSCSNTNKVTYGQGLPNSASVSHWHYCIMRWDSPSFVHNASLRFSPLLFLFHRYGIELWGKIKKNSELSQVHQVKSQTMLLENIETFFQRIHSFSFIVIWFHLDKLKFESIPLILAGLRNT